MEFLQSLFGDESLSYEQFKAKVTESKIKIADLSGGAYVGKDKFDTLLADRDNLKSRLDEANGKLEGYDPEWKSKAEKAQQEAENKILSMQRSQMVKEKSEQLKFSSESARRAFLADLEAKNLPVEDGKMLGFDDFVSAYRETDPAAFAPDRPAPTITIPGKGVSPKQTEQQYLDSKYKNNPYYKPKGE